MLGRRSVAHRLLFVSTEFVRPRHRNIIVGHLHFSRISDTVSKGGAAVPESTVENYLDQLRKALAPVAPISRKPLEELHKAGNYEEMVRVIRRAMNLEIKLTVAWVNAGGQKSN